MLDVSVAASVGFIPISPSLGFGSPPPPTKLDHADLPEKCSVIAFLTTWTQRAAVAPRDSTAGGGRWCGRVNGKF
jgi:hypothetical protein